MWVDARVIVMSDEGETPKRNQEEEEFPHLDGPTPVHTGKALSCKIRGNPLRTVDTTKSPRMTRKELLRTHLSSLQIPIFHFSHIDSNLK